MEANQEFYFWGSMQIRNLSEEMTKAKRKRREQIEKEINQIRFHDGGIRVPENHNVFAIKA